MMIDVSLAFSPYNCTFISVQQSRDVLSKNLKVFNQDPRQLRDLKPMKNRNTFSQKKSFWFYWHKQVSVKVSRRVLRCRRAVKPSFLHEEPQGFKGRQKTHTHNNVYLLCLVLLLIQRSSTQLKQGGGDANRQVVGVHFVDVGILQDVMEDAEQTLEEEFVVHWEFVCDPGGWVAKRGRKEEETKKRKMSLAAFFFKNFPFVTEDR